MSKFENVTSDLVFLIERNGRYYNMTKVNMGYLLLMVETRKAVTK